MEFRKAEHLSLAVELDCHLIEPSSLCHSTRASVLTTSDAPTNHFRASTSQSSVTLVTTPTCDVLDMGHQLRKAHRTLTERAVAHGLGLASTGTHPLARQHRLHHARAAAAGNTLERAIVLLRRTVACGMRVSIGMKDAETCVRFHNAFLNLQPIFLALSASSPFWEAEDTGMATCRPNTYSQVPTAGHPYRLKSWMSFELLIKALRRSGSIGSVENMLWDVCPNPKTGSLDLRAFDGAATIEEATTLAALAIACARLVDSETEIQLLKPLPRWAVVENKWRAMCSGTNADLLIDADGSTRPLVHVVDELLRHCQMSADWLEPYELLVRRLIRQGNSATRQRQVFQRRASLDDVVRHNVREFTEMRPVWPQGKSDLAAAPMASVGLTR